MVPDLQDTQPPEQTIVPRVPQPPSASQSPWPNWSLLLRLLGLVGALGAGFVLALPNLPWDVEVANVLGPFCILLGVLGLPLVASALLRTRWALVIVPALVLLGAYVGLVYQGYGLDLPRLLDVGGFITNAPDVVGFIPLVLVPLEVAVVVGTLLGTWYAKPAPTGTNQRRVPLGGLTMSTTLKRVVAVLAVLAMIAGIVGGLYLIINPPTPSGSQMINDVDQEIMYAGLWQYQPHRGLGDYNDDVHVGLQFGDYAQLGFHGTQVDYIADVDPSNGVVDVYLDNQKVATVALTNCAATDLRQTQQTVYRSPTLPRGTHNIQVVSASSNPPQCALSPTHYLVVDAFRIKP